jgi:hypothetical protein
LIGQIIERSGGEQRTISRRLTDAELCDIGENPLTLAPHRPATTRRAVLENNIVGVTLFYQYSKVTVWFSWLMDGLSRASVKIERIE